jgi:hypothetical protein
VGRVGRIGSTDRGASARRAKAKGEGAQVKRNHNALLDEIEKAVDRDRNGIEVLTPEKAYIYFKKLEAVMEGEIGDREWRLHEALKARRK